MTHRIALLALLLTGPTALAAEPKPSQADLDFFESKIRPVLSQHCYQCHSAQAASQRKLKSELTLDTAAGLLKGGKRGPAIVPGKPADSLLIKAIRHHDKLKMPPKGKLGDDVIANFERWVKLGAPDSRTGEALDLRLGAPIDIDEGKRFWSFQPLKHAAPPQVKDKSWSHNPIDRFIAARHEAHGLQSVGVAQPQTLIRRAYFDLIGLPPTPAQVDAFVKQYEQDAQAAYAQLIDELLASPRYGERWGRHWLDLARFAESNGYAFDKDRANAYRYRDFVIRAFNDDMPYDRFVRLQVAGDLLAKLNPTTPEEAQAAAQKIAATGFLVAGPFTTQQTQKERERSRYEQLDDMVHTLGTSLLGLTVGCARCHEHKYDPLPQPDYYRMIAIFSQVGFADVGINMEPTKFAQSKAAFDKAHAPIVAARTSFEQEQLPVALTTWLDNRPEHMPAPGFSTWQHIGPFPAESFDKAYDQAFGPENQKQVDLKKTFADGRLKWTEQPTWKDGVVHNTLTGENAANYLFRVVESPVARKVTLSLGSDDAIRVWINRKHVLGNKIGRGAAADQEKVTIPLKKGRNELLIKIVNGGGPSGFYFKSSLDGTPANVEKILQVAQDKWDDKQRKQVLDWFKTTDENWLALNTAVEEHKKQEPKPKLTMMYAAKTRGSTYNFGGDTYKVYYLSRGNADNKQGEAPAGFLQVLMRSPNGGQRWLDATQPNQQKQAKPSRLALADWLTDTQHGAGHLLARVIVNRLWQHHFGQGIVLTPSDFGTRGERPTHPELLDWLASELIRNGWRLKPMHRLMMTSRAYRLGSGEYSASEKADPDNMLVWRRSPRRLEAEAIRDSLFAVAGTLDTTMYGKGSLDERTPRRSVYLTVKRSRLIPMLQLFDAPDAMQSIGKREASTVAPQALAMMNSPLVRDIAGKLAARARPDAKTTLDDAIANAYRIAFSRPPTADELVRMKGFIEHQAKARGGGNAEALAFRDACHTLLCMNEFVYVD